jgi:hypothetical protein
LLNGNDRPHKAEAVIIAVELKSGGTVYGSLLGYDRKPDKKFACLVVQKHSQIEFAIRRTDGILEKIGEQWPYIFIPFDEVSAVSAGFSAKPS